MKRFFFGLVLMIITISIAQLLFYSSLTGGILVIKKELKNNEISESEEKVSETDADKSENMNSDLKGFYEHQDIVCQNNRKQYETLQKTVDNYIHRYISLFLITSNLLSHNIDNPAERITIELEISITGEDLAYLQNYSKGLKDLNYQKNLSKLDAIFSKIARLKERSYAEKAMRSSMSLFTSFIFNLLNSPSFYRFFSFISILIVIWISRYYLFNRSFYVFLFVFINSTIIWEGFNLYSKKIKEVDLEIYVQTLQFKGLPEDCDPANIRWYHSLYFFSKNKCLQYYETLNKNAVEEVSLFKCIIDMYTFYFIRIPIKIYGMSVRDLTDELLASFPSPLKFILNIPLIPMFAVMGGVFILILYGKRFKFSVFGTSIEIGDSKTVPEQKMIDNSNNEPKSIRRKLKPWTKSRYPRRLEVDFGRRRKLFLKSSRSMIEMPESSATQMSNSLENASSFNASNETLMNR